MTSYVKIKEEIEGIRTVSEVVQAVQRIAASQIGFLRRTAKPLDEYLDELRRMLGDFTVFYRLEHHPLLSPRKEGDRLIIAVFGSRGLSGGLDDGLLQELKRVKPQYDQVVVVGKRGAELMREEGLEPDEVMPAASDRVTAEEAAAISDHIVSRFLSGGLRAVDVLYPHFESLAEQHARLAPFLPFTMPETGAVQSAEGTGFPIFSPDKQEVADRLIRAYLGVYFKAKLTEAKLSELAARTVAMEHAGSQSKKEVRESSLRYFKERRRELSRRQIESFFAHQAI